MLRIGSEQQQEEMWKQFQVISVGRQVAGMSRQVGLDDGEDQRQRHWQQQPPGDSHRSDCPNKVSGSPSLMAMLCGSPSVVRICGPEEEVVPTAGLVLVDLLFLLLKLSCLKEPAVFKLKLLEVGLHGLNPEKHLNILHMKTLTTTCLKPGCVLVSAEEKLQAETVSGCLTKEFNEPLQSNEVLLRHKLLTTESF